jgi:hypothetical protein
MRPFLVGLIIAVAPSTAFAELEVPQFSHGGFLVGFDWGDGLWGLDRNSLGQSFLPVFGQSVADNFASNIHDSWATLGINLGYNIKGHATIGISFTATGWDVFAPTRGGSGNLVGTLAWHPLELVFLNKEKRPFGVDFSLIGGLGYGIVGYSGGSGQRALGADGLVGMFGGNVDYFFSRNFGLGFFVKGFFLHYSTLYQDWDTAHSSGSPAADCSSLLSAGAAGCSLAKSGNNAGFFTHIGIQLILRVGD